MTTLLRAALILVALARTARPDASHIDEAARECGAGKADACAQLSAKARGSHDGSVRRAAAQRLIQARLRYCSSTAGLHSLWGEGQRVRLDTEYLFEHELEASRQAEIERAGDQFLADALRSVGLEVSKASKPGDAVVELTLLGAARAWLFGTTELGGPMEDIDNSVGMLLYPDATWEGVVTVRKAGRCIYSEPLRPATGHRLVFDNTIYHKPAQAPFRSDLASALAPVMVRLGTELYGTAAIARMATSAAAQKLRETALEKLHDQNVLGIVAKNDSSELLRWTAVGRLKDQAALAESARHDGSAVVRLTAIQRLKSAAVLAEIAREDGDPEVRRKARMKLEKLGTPR